MTNDVILFTWLSVGTSANGNYGQLTSTVACQVGAPL